ncbi:c-type cytochrome [Massilia sp. IC2-476]|uniref:c-type cytochrome n=1 Tax=Massilia sp. IC2-476 TaxID=2887199 RepID=UPI001D0F662D|nr:c-type cytochrome [Massilia sp. IC2-476]MCC2972288.1 c-type cytochrome [Massilia sp. IC2-476]
MSHRRTLFVGLTLAAGALHAAPQTVPDTLAQRLVACTSCHARVDARGNPVNDSYFPRIAGKPAGYLYNQLLNFREGRRQYPLMTYLVDHLPDPYLREIAGYYAALPPAAHAPETTNAAPQVLERGRQLVMNGDSARKVPACVACHGQRLTGVEPGIPGLLGLPRDYVNAQFGAWRNKARRAHAPDCMAEVTARLSLEDVNAVSSWLAAQPVPADPRPAAAIARPLPLACGSAPEHP